MPCDQYELHLQNSVAVPAGSQDAPVASLDQSTSTVTGLQLGHINVVLDHKSILLSKHNTSACFVLNMVQIDVLTRQNKYKKS